MFHMLVGIGGGVVPVCVVVALLVVVSLVLVALLLALVLVLVLACGVRIDAGRGTCIKFRA